MAYIVGQYNKSSSTKSMTSIVSGGVVARLSSESEEGTGFEEECLEFNDMFLKDQVYYFHGSVKRLYNKQTFDVSLMNDDDFDEVQVIKTIDIGQGAEGWVDVEFIFKPVKNFNRLAFILHRTRRDYYGGDVRYPIIIYQELSQVNNLIPIVTGGMPLLKLGIQADPGTITVINGEEIRIGKTGMDEIRNGFIEMDFFSVVAPAGTSANIEAIQTEIDGSINDVDLAQVSLSRCLIDYNNGIRELADFTLDYVYDEGGNE